MTVTAQALQEIQEKNDWRDGSSDCICNMKHWLN